jgi:ionotropic glutamate receptor
MLGFIGDGRYSILQVNDTRLEKQSEALPGLTYYMQKGVNYHTFKMWNFLKITLKIIVQKCDLVIGALVMTPDRYALMDFAEGYAYSSMVILIPMPESSDNGAAITQPFQISVKDFFRLL